MRLTDEGLNAIIELRGMQMNNTWEKYWFTDTRAA